MVQESCWQTSSELFLQQLQEIIMIMITNIMIINIMFINIMVINFTSQNTITTDKKVINCITRKSVGKRNMLSAHDLNDYYWWLQQNG